VIESFDETLVTFSFLDPVPVLGVLGEGLGVDALSGQDGELGGVDAQIGAVCTDVGVGTGALGGSAGKLT
jgi:hypothetical protein